MQKDTDIVGWITVKGRRVPLRKGKGHAKTKSGWDKPKSPYSGAGEDYQHLYKGGKKIARVASYDSDGDVSYDVKVYRKKKDLNIPGYETREKAQRAAETHIKLDKEEQERNNRRFHYKSYGGGPDGAELGRLINMKKKR